jgi:hypothetical protein
MTGMPLPVPKSLSGGCTELGRRPLCALAKKVLGAAGLARHALAGNTELPGAGMHSLVLPPVIAAEHIETHVRLDPAFSPRADYLCVCAGRA